MESFDKPRAEIAGETEAGRARKVREHIENIKQTLQLVNLDLAELLLEATEKDYFRTWGYESRAAYAEANLDMKERQIFYLTRIMSVSRSLNIPRSEIENIGISKLREIFSLEPDQKWVNPETQIAEPLDDHIRRLLTLAPSLSYAAIKEEVKKLKGLVGDNDMAYLNLGFTRVCKDNVIVPGLNRFRAFMGSRGITGPDGTQEYSDAFVVEHIMAEILSGVTVEESEIQDEVLIEEAQTEQTEELLEEAA